MTGLLIAFEGIDGAGKSCLVARVAEQLGALRCVATSEPFRKEAVRVAIKAGESIVDVYTDDRAEHFRDVIAPAMMAGKIVLCDRYFWSTIVYQSQGMTPDERAVLWVRQHRRHIAPDLWVHVETDYRIAARRVEDRGEEMTPFIRQQLGCLAEAYGHIKRRTLGANVVTVDGTMGMQHNAARVVLEIGRLLR